MLKIAICDDEPQMADEITAQLAQYMKKMPHIPYTIHTFPSSRALLESRAAYDLILLDIQMQAPDGMETARQLRRQGIQSPIIFITILQECVYDAFDVEACGYLLKPVDPARFSRTLDRALKTLRQRAAKNLLIRRGTSCEIIPLAQIIYCEVQGRKIYIHQTNQAVLDYYDRLESLEQRLDARFFKCHRSYLVNLDHVRGCKNGQVLLPQGEAIPVSRLREHDLTQALLRHMKEREH